MKRKMCHRSSTVPGSPMLFSLPLSAFLLATLLFTTDCKNVNVKAAAVDLPLRFDVIPYESDDIVAPGRGAEQWHDQNKVKIPNDSATGQLLDKYYRFSWKDIEKADSVYNWEIFDREINDAIAHRQKFSFGIMQAYPGGASELKAADAAMFYPLYLHEKMQQEEIKDWISPVSNIWVPNWNSSHYLSALERLNRAINAHLDTGSFENVRYKHVINYIDIRGYGSWGEWHSHEIVERMSQYPPGTRATSASLIRIIDSYVKGFPDYQLVIMFNAFDGNRLQNTQTAPEVAYHALTARNNRGLLGWRRDNWGALDDYIRQYTDRNRVEHNGMRFDTAIMNRYKYAPVNGEPIPGGSFARGCEYGELEAQVKRYHASSFGNGNYSDHSKTCMHENIRAASKAAGYRLLLEGGDIPPTLAATDSLIISLQWKNAGIAPVYEDWDVFYELRDEAGALAWSGASGFKPRLFLPGENGTLVKESYRLPKKFKPGSYKLNLVIKDPNGYRAPLPLAIRGRNNDGSYTLQHLAVSSKKHN